MFFVRFSYDVFMPLYMIASVMCVFVLESETERDM